MSSDRPVVLFMFAGREQNMRVNLPQIQRILDENPRVQFHVWNLARNEDDADFLRLIEGDRIDVLHQFSGPRAHRNLNKVWDYYTRPRFRHHLFVKIDDDMLFFQTEKFAEFVDAVEATPDKILSAEVVNNGACTPFMPELWQKFLSLDIPLLDVHESNRYAQFSHSFMFDSWRDLVKRPTALVDIETWLSINFIGMHWPMLELMSNRIGRRSPEFIADRQWSPSARIGDEGAANLFPRAVMTGFTVAHLGFGPQKLTDTQEREWSQRYGEIATEYQAGVANRNSDVVGGLW